MNALIYRLPRRITLFSSRSRSQCPKCGFQLSWFENIPLLSYIFLLGRCRKCRTLISPRYPIVELTVGLFAFAATPNYISAEKLTTYFFFISVFASLLAIFLIDIEFKIIPNELNLYLGLIFLSMVIMTKPYAYWLVGGLVGFLFPLAVTYAFYLIKGQVGLGGGDIKLYGVLGIFLGPVGVIQNIFLSCFIGAIVGGVLIMSKVVDRKTPIPFGPFIVIVASLQIFIPEYFARVVKFLMLA